MSWMVDTGHTYRAMLPFDNATSRSNLVYYSGPTLVKNFRTMCRPPRFHNASISLIRLLTDPEDDPEPLSALDAVLVGKFVRDWGVPTATPGLQGFMTQLDNESSENSTAKDGFWPMTIFNPYSWDLWVENSTGLLTDSPWSEIFTPCILLNSSTGSITNYSDILTTDARGYSIINVTRFREEGP